MTAINKTERKNILSKYLQNNMIGEINELDECYFTQLYHNFYSYEDGRNKFRIDDIQKVITIFLWKRYELCKYSRPDIT